MCFRRWNMADLGGLHGKTLGLLGIGGIGQAVATRALALLTARSRIESSLGPLAAGPETPATSNRSMRSTVSRLE